MPLPTAVLRAVKPPNNAPRRTPPPTFLRFIFQPDPEPINCCTQNTTRDYLDKSHPYHIRTTRRLAAFDPNILHTSVVAHVDVAKKRVVRSWVTRRVRTALREELQARGWGMDGQMLGTQSGRNEGTGRTYAKSPLRGALKIYMAKDRRKEVITASGDEVRRNVSAIVKEVVRRQSRATPGQAMRDTWRFKGRGDGSRADTPGPSIRRAVT